MTFLPLVRVAKSGDNITVLIRQSYKARGHSPAHRWRIAGVFSLAELKKKEKA